MKLFCIWSSGSGGDAHLRYFLSGALVAHFVQLSRTICAILVEGIMINISLNLFQIWASGLEEMSSKRFLIWSSGGPRVQWSKTIMQL